MDDKTQREQQTRYYNKNHSYMDKIDTPYAKNIFKRVTGNLGMPKDAKVLEVGCGAGRFTCTFLKQGYNVTGLDVSESLLNKLKAKITPGTGLNIILGTAEEASKKHKEEFDYAIGFHVLHHIRNLGSLMHAIHKMLKPGGKMMFIEPNPYGPLFYLQVVFEKDISWKGEKGILDITPRKLGNILTASGFVNTTINRFGIIPPALQFLPAARQTDNLAARLPLANYLLIFQEIKAQKPELKRLKVSKETAGKDLQVAGRQTKYLEA